MRHNLAGPRARQSIGNWRANLRTHILPLRMALYNAGMFVIGCSLVLALLAALASLLGLYH